MPNSFRLEDRIGKDQQDLKLFFTNIFLKKSNKLYTPALGCGLLPGVLREYLLSNNLAHEKALYLNDLLDADNVYLGNSVRGLIEAEVVIEKAAVSDRM